MRSAVSGIELSNFQESTKRSRAYATITTEQNSDRDDEADFSAVM